MEMKCPKCLCDMKEYITHFKCRICNFNYTKKFQFKKTELEIFKEDYDDPLTR